MAQPTTPQPPADLSAADKTKWNLFIDFVAANKMNGAPVLDQRNKQVGMSLLQQFNMANPKNALPTNIIPQVQQSLQNYRNSQIPLIKSGQVKIDGVTDPDKQYMAGISAVDGWPGTKTLSSRFPVAKEVLTTPTATTVKDFGTDLASYNANK